MFVYIKDMKNTGMDAIPNNKPIMTMGIFKNGIHATVQANKNKSNKNK